MPALDDAALLTLWKWGRDRHPLDRAIAALMAGDGLSWDIATSLSIGARDGRLISLYLLTFGAIVSTTTRCGGCGAISGLNVDCRQLLLDTTPAEPVQRLVVDGEDVVFRLPDSNVLAAVQPLVPAIARERVLRACILEPASPSDAVMEAVAAALPARDPQAHIELVIACPDCGLPDRLKFNIDACFWDAVEARASRATPSTTPTPWMVTCIPRS